MLEEDKKAERPERMSFVFEGKALENLYQIAEREDRRLDEVIEDALGLKIWTLQVKEDGGRVIAQRDNSEDRELIF